MKFIMNVFLSNRKMMKRLQRVGFTAFFGYFKKISYSASFVLLLFCFPAVADIASDYQSAQNYIQSTVAPSLASNINQNNIPIAPNVNPPEANYYKNPGSIAGDSIALENQEGSIANTVS